MKQKAKEVRGHSLAQYESTQRLFVDFIDDKAIRLVTRQDVAKFVDAVGDLNPNWGRGGGNKSLSFAEIKARHGDHPDGLANKTINRYLTALTAVWQWAKARGEVAGENPFSGQFRPVNAKTMATYTHFDDTDLSLLFASNPSSIPYGRYHWSVCTRA